MAERLRKAAAWLGLVTDDRYSYEDRDAERTDAVELTEQVEDSASITVLDSRRDKLAASGTEASVAVGGYAPAPRSSSSRSGGSAAATAAPAPTVPTSSAPRTADVSRIITVHPRTYNEARTIGEHFRDGVPVIMNLSEMEDADAKRLVDFSAGLIFGLRGTIERVTSKVFLLSPHNVNVTAEDKERIVGGFFNQS
jgi:cell division inhibitor SepF